MSNMSNHVKSMSEKQMRNQSRYSDEGQYQPGSTKAGGSGFGFNQLQSMGGEKL